MPRRPSIDSSIAVSSPQTYEPAPTTSSIVRRRASPRSGDRLAASRRPRGRVLLAQVDVAALSLGELHRHQEPFEHQVRAELHDVAVLDRARLALVGVHDHDPRPGLAAHRLPLAPGGKARRRRGRPGRMPLARASTRSGGSCGGLAGVSGRLSPSEGPSFVKCVTGARHRPPRAPRARGRAGSCRRACRPARARSGRDRHLDHRHTVGRDLLCDGQQPVPAQARTHGPRAHPQRIERQAQERVQRDDLGHLSAPDPHVVGERVGELGVTGPTSRRM